MSGLRATISVDDGHPSDLKVAALLAHHGLQATFYVPVRNREGPPVMSAAQLRTLAQRFEIGAHTLTHQFLAGLDDGTAWREIADGKRALEDRLGLPVHGFCYPGGRYRRAQIRQVHAAGFRFARTTQNLRIDADGTAFELPTSAQFYPHPRAVWLRNFVSQRDWRRRAPALRAVLGASDWRVRLYRLLALADAHGGVFHLWLHALDIERLQLWTTLDSFLAQLAQRVPPHRRIVNGELLRTIPAAYPSTPSENNAT